MSLIECLVAVALIVIVLTPTTWFVIEGNRVSYVAHLRAEATNLATQALEGIQLEAAQGQLPAGFQSQTQSVDETAGRKTVFKIATTWSTTTQGTDTSICASGSGPSQQIWVATASVTWAGSGSGSPVVQTTEISPAQAGALQFASGELALRLSLDGGATNLYLASRVTATVTGVWTGAGSAPSVPSGESTSATDTSGAPAPGGCIVFSDLDVAAGWVYNVSFAGNPTVVSQQEYSDANPNRALHINNIILQAGVPDIVTVEVNTSSTVNVNYVKPGTACNGSGALTTPATSSVIPVSVSNTGLSYTAYPPSSGPTWVAYGAASFTSVALFPTTLQTGMWDGDMPYGAPNWSGWGTHGLAVCTVGITTAGSSSSVSLPLYPLVLHFTSGTAASITATETGEAGGYTFSLANPSSSTSSTSLPLGEYTVSDSNGPISLSGTPVLVWLSPAGECFGASGVTTPPATCTGSSLSVPA